MSDEVVPALGYETVYNLVYFGKLKCLGRGYRDTSFETGTLGRVNDQWFSFLNSDSKLILSLETSMPQSCPSFIFFPVIQLHQTPFPMENPLQLTKGLLCRSRTHYQLNEISYKDSRYMTLVLCWFFAVLLLCLSCTQIQFYLGWIFYIYLLYSLPPWMLLRSLRDPFSESLEYGIWILQFYLPEHQTLV